MADHAILSASGSKKWLTCTPSARLEEQFPDDSSADAKDGTKAHEFMELACRQHYFKEPTPEHLNTVEKRRAAGFTDAMVDAVKVFVEECRKITDPMDEAGIPYTVLIEQKLDYSPWVPEGFGTGDFVVVSNTTLWVRDFKYGQGVRVEAEDNPQMKLYGLGAYNELSFAYDGIDTLDIGIVQPRIGNVTSWRVSLADLLTWGQQIQPIAQAAWEGKGEFVSGTHCSEGFCRARFTCRARAEQNLATATEEFGDKPRAETLTDDEIDALLPRLEALAKWVKDIESYAYKQAMAGVRFPNHKLVEGRSNRYIADERTAAVRLVANGFPEHDIFKERELLGITALTELVGKKKFNELLDDLLVKPVGKPTLVPASDKRSEWHPATAEDDFAD